jgi:outer membrane protein OmpA-like peptidoglycan-associated protein
MQVAFNINSYFVNVAATNELKSIAAKYSSSDVFKVLTIGYSSPSAVNPYPSKLGLWRAAAIAKTLRKTGLRGE